MKMETTIKMTSEEKEILNKAETILHSIARKLSASNEKYYECVAPLEVADLLTTAHLSCFEDN